MSLSQRQIAAGKVATLALTTTAFALACSAGTTTSPSGQSSGGEAGSAQAGAAGTAPVGGSAGFPNHGGSSGQGATAGSAGSAGQGATAGSSGSAGQGGVGGAGGATGGAAGSGGAQGPVPILADYAGELREKTARADGNLHVDSPALVNRLVQLNANHYAFLIYHKPSDWDDLQEYLPLAEKAGLKTWAYLVPPTEIPSSYPPFESDYVAWGAAIGNLSTKYPGLTGWVMDDFNGNTKVFTPAYTCSMVNASKKTNKDLKFYVIDYYPNALNDLPRKGYASCIDGLIYPYRDLDSNDKLAGRINRLAELRTVDGARLRVSFPSNTQSSGGQYGRHAATCLADGTGSKISFTYRDTYDGPTSGYHRARVVVGGTAVWTEDTAGTDSGKSVTLDIEQYTQPNTPTPIHLELYENHGVSNYAVSTTFDQVKVDGCGLGGASDWSYSASNSHFTGSAVQLEPNPNLSIITMIYAAPTSWHAAKPDKYTIKEGLEIGLKAWKAGTTQGVITYVLDKRASSDAFPLVQSVYGSY